MHVPTATPAARRVRLVLALALAVLVTACSATYRNHGYVPDDTELAEITVGVDDRASVEDLIGRPGAQGMLRENAWYYVGSRWEHYAYKAPRPVERNIVAVSFDSAGLVSNIERFGLEDGQVVTLTRRITDSGIQGVSLLRQLFGNIGQIDPGALPQ